MSAPALHETLYAASSNAGKLRDFAAAAVVFGVEIAVLPGLSDIPAPEENGATFEANARLKAEQYSRARPGLLVLADDSGLEVNALGGAPGVRSARYADDADFDLTDSEDPDGRNNLYLLEQLRGHARPWTARYRCVLALARDGVTLLMASGAVEGEITREPHGMGGFGYDPLFWLPELGKTMAEIDLETKQRLSHRGRALTALLAEMKRSDFVNTNVIHEVLAESQAGKLVFPEVVRRLAEVGVESYFSDLARGEETFYMADGTTHVEKMTLPLGAVAEKFSSSGIIAAIRGAQTDAIRYPEFVKQSTAAGVIAYWAFLTGRKVIYFGRKGEQHIEEFPPLKS